tara:strand:- start:8925 stop:9209 length:285 start_codon:yes stop_codon:yes gene_type:complete
MDDSRALSNVPGWPIPCAVVEVDEKLVLLTGIPQKYKQIAWKQIKDRSPGLAELLQDPLLKAIVTMFDAEILVDAQFAPALPVYRPLRTNKGIS